MGCALPFHSGVYVSGHFNDLAAVAFLPPPRSPASSSLEPRSPPLLSKWNDEATPPTSLHGKAHPWTHSTHVYERNGLSFLKSVYCLSGLGIVRKNRSKPKHFNRKKMFFLVESIIYRLISVFSLRSFNHEFTRFEKKELSMERLNKSRLPDTSSSW